MAGRLLGKRALVYGGGTPAFAQAFGDFDAVAEALLEVLP